MRELLQPIKRGIIHCLCDIDSEVESTMIRTSKSNDKLARLLLYFTDFKLWYFSFQEGGLDEESFVPEMFWAFAEMGLK